MARTHRHDTHDLDWATNAGTHVSARHFPRMPADSWMIRQDNRNRRFRDRDTLRAIASGRLDADAAVFTPRQRDRRILPSW